MDQHISMLLSHALIELGLAADTLDRTALRTSCVSHPLRDNSCLLRQLLDMRHRGRPVLHSSGFRSLLQLTDAGWSLRYNWPRERRLSIQSWLGERLYFAHASRFGPAIRVATLVSSQLGRHSRKLPQWPSWIDAALRNIYRNGQQLLIVPGTTNAEVAQQFASSAGIPLWNVRCHPAQEPQLANLVDWLDELLIERPGQPPLDPHNLFVSPSFAEPANSEASRLASRSEGDCTLGMYPLQDRIALALADTVYALAIRRGGNIEHLLTQRLRDVSFPTASVFVAIHSAGQKGLPADATRWLDLGAVGWLVHSTAAYRATWMVDCRPPPAAAEVKDQFTKQFTAPQQLSAPLPQAWQRFSDSDEWDYLCHCTRGLSGPLPNESEERFRERVWLDGLQVEWHPLERLTRICREGCLRGTAEITRTLQRCVSWSAVPLVPLLQRRCFRAHLGRWDWEPYGVLIRRQTLVAAGAAAVVYGSENDFQNLGADQQPFFQPLGKKTKASQTNWSLEREWRTLGDLKLAQLDPNSVMLFVRTRREAERLARRSAWPVFWVETHEQDSPLKKMA